MTIGLTVGAKVTTLRYGPGTVTRLTAGGAVVAIARLAGLELEVPTADMQWEVPDASSVETAEDRLLKSIFGEITRTLAEVPQETPLDESAIAARTALEALRFGVVPSRSLGALTVGFDKLERWVQACLPSSDEPPRVSEVCGRFGTGKSHTMSAIRHIASEAGWVHAQVEVDGERVSLSDPAGVLRQLWKTIEGKDLQSNTPLVQLTLQAAKKHYATLRQDLAHFDRVLHNTLLIEDVDDHKALDAHSEDLELLLGCSDELTGVEIGGRLAADVRLSGRRWQGSDIPLAPKVIIGRRVEERADDFVNCLLGYAVLSRLAGHKGLVVTIDEFEVEYNLPLRLHARLETLLDRMTERLIDETAEGVPLAIFIATVGQDGEDSDPFVDDVVENTGGSKYVLDDWDDEMRYELSRNIARLYDHAYGTSIDVDEDDIDDLYRAFDEYGSESVVRRFIKRYVAHLDSQHGPPA